jgi:hypothetical protein
MAWKRQSGSKLPRGDILLLIRRGADEMDAVMNASDRHPSMNPEDAAGLRGNGDHSAYQQGDATEREAARPDLDANAGWTWPNDERAGGTLERRERWQPRSQWQQGSIPSSWRACSIGNTQLSAGYDRQLAQDERGAGATFARNFEYGAE